MTFKGGIQLPKVLYDSLVKHFKFYLANILTFSDDFSENESLLICLNSLHIRSKTSCFQISKFYPLWRVTGGREGLLPNLHQVSKRPVALLWHLINRWCLIDHLRCIVSMLKMFAYAFLLTVTQCQNHWGCYWHGTFPLDWIFCSINFEKAIVSENYTA